MISSRSDLLDPVIEALKNHKGRAHLTVVTKDIWDKHQDEIVASANLRYTWQYDIRWVAYTLRKTGRLKPAVKPYTGIWELA